MVVAKLDNGPLTPVSEGTPALDSPASGPSARYGKRRPYHFSTQCVTVENPLQKDQYGSSSVPIYQTATFKGMGGEYDYTRSGNPTRSHLEHHIAKISSAAHAFVVSSGMAALDVITRLLKPGDEVIAGDDLYGGTNRLLTYLKNNGGITVHHAHTTDATAVVPYLRAGKTAMVLLESPTNPLLKVVDIASICASVRQLAPDALVVVDNTMMSPYLQRPLEHGADMVYDSGTKYLSGHHDLMAGVVVCDRDDVAQKLAFTINAVGNALSPFDSFLLLRGIKTMAIRMDRQQSSAMRVATYLNNLGFKTFYPGLPNHPGREIHERLANGYGAVLSFVTGDKALSERIVGATRLWGISVSFGAVNSLISMPCLMSHASIDAATRAERGLPEDLIRLCVGIEDPADLLEDLELALLQAGAISSVELPSGERRLTRVHPDDGTGLIGMAVEKISGKLDGVHLKETDPESREWFISAPGKVILFGEHAVVHGVTAIAAAVNLRCFSLTSPRQDGKIGLRLPDLGGYEEEWVVEDLPWEALRALADGEPHGPVLDEQLIAAVTNETLRKEKATKSSQNAAVAFLYLYMMLARDDSKPAFTFTARSNMPISAGLGSSAAYSTCVASALLFLHRRISMPHEPAPSTAAHGMHPGHVHISHGGRVAIPKETADEINAWAFISEKVLHGNPSGIDNSVAVYGGSLAYTRPGFARKAGLDPLHGFKSLRFLLVDSKVPRDTKSLVAGVGKRKAEEPDVINPILDAIQDITEEARRALEDHELPRSTLISGLGALIDENHDHLVSLGVSHPTLEIIRAKTASAPYNLRTKLTGAGGGGCAVTLIPDGFPDETLEQLVAELREEGFDAYATTVGGSGMGVFSPRSGEDAEVISTEGGDEQMRVPLSKQFLDKDKTELAQWVEARGRWLYV
ncbi:cystathionine beta-lyase [Dacryopinax primogenitus]|uniref:Cystathionine beta-lyase n=1 Tax=Dacryopinax primogenitus (strain DJM 731) TaxID=1858805 RepID=M5GDR0_DACPD|nr:cystathionine beta-lyase [Dacryopinax primogenitus]EJU04737.1 cystathionine beta-lyase [Dacryopinax primogenitus]